LREELKKGKGNLFGNSERSVKGALRSVTKSTQHNFAFTRRRRRKKTISKEDQQPKQGRRRVALQESEGESY
jgi:ribosomal protein L20